MVCRKSKCRFVGVLEAAVGILIQKGRNLITALRPIYMQPYLRGLIGKRTGKPSEIKSGSRSHNVYGNEDIIGIEL
jgi:hypothetical protein